ncbi:MAG: lipid A biosynthesis lauroyl acyltransferase [Pseudomonadota bacterium]
MLIFRRILTHLGLIPARLLGHLPLRISCSTLRAFAPLIEGLMKRRRLIVDRNLEMCFPEWDAAQRMAIRRAHFQQLSEAVAETAFCWCHRGRLTERHGRIEGLENLERARADGRGVLLITGHTTCLELGGRLFAEQVDVRGVYRRLRNPVLNHFQTTGRNRYSPGMVERSELKAMIRYLRAGEVVWYAPDQDFGPERSVFVEFFGLQTATSRGPLELARMGRASVLPMFPLKNPDTGQVTVHMLPAFDHFPSDDPAADLRRYNAFLEDHIRRQPAQYWWLHRRFKSVPEGEVDRYAC